LTCIDGDPDRPIIAGAVPNPTAPSPVIAKYSERNVIRTGGGSEINIDDTEGSSRVKITVPFGNTMLQLGAPNLPTPGFAVTTDNDATVDGKSIRLHASDDVWIRGDSGVEVAGPDVLAMGESTLRLQSLGGAQLTSPYTAVTGDDLMTLLSGGVGIVSGALTLLVLSGGEVTISAPKVKIENGEVTVNGSTVTISGSTVKVTGDIQLNPE
jgi:hypothetical protein